MLFVLVYKSGVLEAELERSDVLSAPATRNMSATYDPNLAYAQSYTWIL